jgi:aldehyde dehydrogenase (NAD+)
MTITADRAALRERGLEMLVHNPSMRIGDRWLTESRGGKMEHINPATGRSNPSFAVASLDEVDEAVAAARAAFAEWRRWAPDARRDVLIRLADLLVANASEFSLMGALEGGHPYNEVGNSYVADWVRYYAGWCDKITGESVNPYPFRGIDFTVPEPIGVVGLFVASNGPVGFCGMAGAPALAAGCCLVIKPPELAPFSTVTFARLCFEAGIPSGVVNVVQGGPQVGQAVASHPGIDKISFTGGTATAKRLQAAAGTSLTPLVMELGGKSANIVFADADLDSVIPASSRWTFNAGQGCSMPTRLLVQRQVYQQVIDGVADIVQRVVVGDPFDPATTMGPVISAASAERIVGMVAEAEEVGAAHIYLGGQRCGGALAEGFFVEPTLLIDVDNSSNVAQNEIFGPVLCIMPFDDEEEAIALANDTRYGLAAYVQTRDMHRAHRLINSLEAGNVHINSTGPGPVSPASPFGGVKESGYGREGGRLGLEEFLSIKNVYWNI